MDDIEVAIEDALDGLWQKLKTDSRMPDRPRFEFVRSAVVEEPTRYPILYFEEGLDRNKQETTRSREHSLQVRIRFFLKDRDPEQGTALARKRCLKIVKTLTETPQDRLLNDANGQARTLDVECPNFAWGVFARDSRTSEIVFSGTIDVTLTLLI